MSDRKAATISIKALSSAVAKAVEQESKNAVFGDEFIVGGNLIIGRILRELIAMEEAEAVATRITQAVSRSGLQAEAAGAELVEDDPFEPAFLFSHGRIICGFIMDPSVILRE